MVQNSLQKEQFFKPSLLYNNKEGFLMVNSVGINNNYYTQQPTLQRPAMRGATNTLERTPEKDTVVATKPKKRKLSTAAKIGIGLTGVVGGLIGTCVLVSQHQTSKLKKLYNEKLVLSKLPEKLEFQEAKTLDEALKFAKDTLKIPEVDKNFTLEALNTANRGLVDVSNAYKGSVFMPRALRYKAVGDSYIAAVVRDIESKHFGEMWINSDMFNHASLNKDLKDALFLNGTERLYPLKEGLITTHNSIGTIPDKKLETLIKSFYENPDKLSITDKQNLYYSLADINQIASLHKRSPLYAFEKISKSNAYENYIKNGGEKFDINKLRGLKTEEQGKEIETLLEKMKDSNNLLSFQSTIGNPRSTIYHEMGHLQDYAENLKKLDIMHWEFNLKKIWKESWENAKLGKTSSNNSAIRQVDNRWATIHKKYYRNLFKTNPEKLKKICPDFYEFLTNQEIQQTAGKVSKYAQSGIGEFIAECHAEMIAGKKLPEDVINLYKKYNGPVVG